LDSAVLNVNAEYQYSTGDQEDGNLPRNYKHSVVDCFYGKINFFSIFYLLLDNRTL